jgi:hypothetical protein
MSVRRAHARTTRTRHQRGAWTRALVTGGSAGIGEAFPRFMVVSCLNGSGALGAFAVRHLPHRLLTPLVARATARFASG